MKPVLLFLITLTPYILWSQHEAYIQQYSKLAQQEQARYGIPTSVTLAQAILESRSGTSMAAQHYNNHFGLHCPEVKGKKHGAECAEYLDGDEVAHLCVYTTVWQSYRAHSIHITSGKYASMKSQCGSDYKKWCTQLRQRGYATDRDYPNKLIRIIEQNNLHERFDRIP